MTLDLVMEIVSRGAEAKQRDYVDKRRDYAKAGIAEYWIVDPQEKIVTVLSLQSTGDQQAEYVEVGCFHVGQTATGRLLPGLSVDVDALMRA